MTAAELIADLGGPSAIARILAERAAPGSKAITAGAISVWTHREKIPRSAWPELMDAFPHVTLARLRAVEAASTPKSRKAA